MIRKLAIACSCAAAFLIGSCGDDDHRPAFATVVGKVMSEADSTPIAGANVVLYDAPSNSPVTRTYSDVDGIYSLTTTSTISFLKVAAQNWIPSPPRGGAPLFFQTTPDSRVNRDFYLRRDSLSTGTSSVSGTVYLSENGVPGLLVTLTRTSDSTAYSTASGPDGVYVIFNVLPGTYQLLCQGAGYNQVGGAASITVSSGSRLSDQNITVAGTGAGTLSGQITFLAAKNSVVDITLINPYTEDAIPGLSVMSSGSQSYSITGIPVGRYIAWATYGNDGYVMDPDWIRKNGLPYVTITEADLAEQLPFSVTDAIIIQEPSNAPDSIYPVPVTSATPTFVWSAYPSSKEYIVKVLNSRGDVVWGGFDATGKIAHPQIPASQVSAVFNFDQSATEAIRPGETYRWIVYADNDDAAGVQTLISSSEEQRGLFYLPVK